MRFIYKSFTTLNLERETLNHLILSIHCVFFRQLDVVFFH